MRITDFVHGKTAKKLKVKFHMVPEEEIATSYLMYDLLGGEQKLHVNSVMFISVILSTGVQDVISLFICFLSGPLYMGSLYKHREAIRLMMNLVRARYSSFSDEKELIEMFFRYPNGLFRRIDLDFLSHFQKSYKDYEYLSLRLSLKSFLEACTIQQHDVLKEYVDSQKKFLQVVTYASQNNAALQFSYEGHNQKVSPICCIRCYFRFQLLGIESVSGIVKKYAFSSITNLHICNTDSIDYTWRDLNKRVFNESFLSVANWALFIPTGSIKGITEKDINSIPNALVRVSYGETGSYGIQQVIIAGEALRVKIYEKRLYKGFPDAVIHLLCVLFKAGDSESKARKRDKKVTGRRTKRGVYYYRRPKSHRKEQFRIRKNHGNIKDYWRSVEEVTNPDIKQYNIKWNKKRDKARITELHFDSFDGYFTRGSTGWKDNGHHYRHQWEPEEGRRVHREVKRENICLSGIADKESFVEEFSDDDITYMLLEECYLRELC